MSKIIALANQKGGVGKTTSTINLAYGLVALGKKVLCVDCDPQGNLTLYFGLQPHIIDKEGKGLYFAVSSDKKPIAELVIEHESGVHLIPTGLKLAEVDPELFMDGGNMNALKEALRPIIDNYDIILIDCAPTLGLLFVNAMAATQYVIIPCKPDMLSLSGIPNLIATVNKVKVKANPQLKILGVLPTLYSEHLTQDKNSFEELVTQARAAGIRVFSPIKRTTEFDKGLEQGKPLIVTNPNHAGALFYQQLAHYIANL